MWIPQRLSGISCDTELHTRNEKIGRAFSDEAGSRGWQRQGVDFLLACGGPSTSDLPRPVRKMHGLVADDQASPEAVLCCCGIPWFVRSCVRSALLCLWTWFSFLSYRSNGFSGKREPKIGRVDALPICLQIFSPRRSTTTELRAAGRAVAGAANGTAPGQMTGITDTTMLMVLREPQPRR